MCILSTRLHLLLSSLSLSVSLEIWLSCVNFINGKTLVTRHGKKQIVNLPLILQIIRWQFMVTVKMIPSSLLHHLSSAQTTWQLLLASPSAHLIAPSLSNSGKYFPLSYHWPLVTLCLFFSTTVRISLATWKIIHSLCACVFILSQWWVSSYFVIISVKCHLLSVNVIHEQEIGLTNWSNRLQGQIRVDRDVVSLGERDILLLLASLSMRQVKVTFHWWHLMLRTSLHLLKFSSHIWQGSTGTFPYLQLEVES